MADDRRFSSPHKQRAPARTPSCGREIWRLWKDGQVMTCELQIDTRAGPWVDVQLVKDGELFASLRLVDKNGACHIAQSWRKDHVKAGWRAGRRVAGRRVGRCVVRSG